MALSAQDRCELNKILDRKYETGTDSPLHHDNACQLCN